MVVDDDLVERARQRRRISAAFMWSRIGVRYGGDQRFDDPAPRQESQRQQQEDQALPFPADAAVESAVAGRPRHGLGENPELVDIRALGVTIRESNGRHAKLDADVVEALSCQAGA
jgi:hypothetical protein